MEIHKALDGGFDDFGERDPVRFRYFTENSRVGETETAHNPDPQAGALAILEKAAFYEIPEITVIWL